MALNEPECLAVALSGPQTHNGRLGPHWAPIHVYTGHWSPALFELGSLNASSGTPLSNSNCPSRLWGWIKREIFIWWIYLAGALGEAEDFLWPCEWRGLGWLGLGLYRASQLKRFAAAELRLIACFCPSPLFPLGADQAPFPLACQTYHT